MVLNTTVDAETANRLNAGDVATGSGYEAAKPETVTTYATQNPECKCIFVSSSIATFKNGGRQRFDSTTVQRGNNITVFTENYQLSGTIEHVGALKPRETLTNRTVTLRIADMRAEITDAI